MGAHAFEMEDVSPDDWFYRYVMRGLDFGLITGTSGDTFRFEPRRNVTRAEFVTMLGRLHEHWEDGSIDVPVDGTFYGHYLAWAVEHEIVLGNQHGDLMAHALITREQMAVMVDRYIGAFELRGYFEFPIPGGWHSPADYRSISEWARSAVINAQNYRLLRGNFDEEGGWFFRPQANCSRVEALAILVRLAELLTAPLGRLCPELEMRIKEDWAARSPMSTPEDVRIDHYFGTYNGKVALMIRDTRGGFPDVVWEQTVAGIVFRYNSGQQIHIWYDGEFFSLPQAYEQGLITRKDVRDINIHHRQAFTFM